jgi:hypothetical protein
VNPASHPAIGRKAITAIVTSLTDPLLGGGGLMAPELFEDHRHVWNIVIDLARKITGSFFLCCW